MSTAITPIEITNKALVLIGALPITTFEETSAEAVIANQVYEDIVIDAISQHDWSFATGQKQLTRLAQIPLAQYNAAYAVPTKPAPASFMRLWINNKLAPFEVSEQRIMCNAALNDTVVLEYQFRAQESRWEPAFRWYVIYRLASEFASAITRKEEMIALWDGKAQRQLDTARARNDKARATPQLGPAPLNQALSLIGALPTTRLSQSAVEKVISAGLYDRTVAACLTQHDWYFAVKQADLAASDTDSNTNRPDAYTLPTDALAAKRLWIEGRLAGFDVQGGLALCDLDYHLRPRPDGSTPKVTLEYVADAPEADWSPSFWWYVTYRLAADLIAAVGAEGAQLFDQKAERQFLKARQENNVNRTPPRLKLRTNRLTGRR